MMILDEADRDGMIFGSRRSGSIAGDSLFCRLRTVVRSSWLKILAVASSQKPRPILP